MCTVTILPLTNTGGPRAAADGGYALRAGVRLVCNRDEMRSRPVALPPQIGCFGDCQAVLPIDPQSGGTWVAASNAQMVFALLNYNPASRRINHTAPISRGLIIPDLLHCSTFTQAAQCAGQLDPARFQPFRLLIIAPGECREIVSDVHVLTTNRFDIQGQPLLFTSSGLGDPLVEGLRRELFESFMVDGMMTEKEQDAFHKHQWPERPHLSVLMNRLEACTVSRTTVELRYGQLAMTYQPIVPTCQSGAYSLCIEPGVRRPAMLRAHP